MQEQKKFKVPVYKPEVCTCCGQTTDYAMRLDRGTAMIVLAIYNAVRAKGKNVVHLTDEMECGKKDFPNYIEMVQAGRMTSNMTDNVLKAKYYGLVAQVEGGGRGEYLITPRGAKFLRGEPVPLIAIIDKKTHTKKSYWYAEEATTTFNYLMRKETPFWQIEPFDVDEVTGTFMSVGGANATLF